MKWERDGWRSRKWKVVVYKKGVAAAGRIVDMHEGMVTDFELREMYARMDSFEMSMSGALLVCTEPLEVFHEERAMATDTFEAKPVENRCDEVTSPEENEKAKVDMVDQLAERALQRESLSYQFARLVCR